MRRAHCEIKDPRVIKRILNSTNIGHLATMDSEGYPYITPVNFVFWEECIYFHCANRGEKMSNMIRNPQVCFEVDIPLAYLEVSFNPEHNPCRAHQLYHCVIIRGTARVLPDGKIKTEILNAMVAKHEGNTSFTPITSELSGYQACCVVEIKPEKVTAKSDLGQNIPQKGYRRFIAEQLAQRGLPGDLEAVRAMGYKLVRKAGKGWHIKD